MMIAPVNLILSFRTTSWLVAALLLLTFISAADAQILVRALLPECAPPDSEQLLEVEIRLEPGDSLKVYDIRLPLDTNRVIPLLDQIDMGSWFSSAGPTFHYCELIDGELIVNQAVLGPGLAVTGSGIAFSIPLQFHQEGVTAAEIHLVDLYDSSAELFEDVISLPADIQIPCPR